MVDDDKDRSRDRTRREKPTRFSESSRDRDRSRDRGTDRSRDKSSASKSSNNCRVYVSNIPYEYRWQDLKDLFRSQVGEVEFVELFVDENDKPRGCGIVEFSDPASVKKCLEVMHRSEVKGRKIVIKEDFGNSRDKYGNLLGSGKRHRERDDMRGRDERRGMDAGRSGRSALDGSDVKWGNTYGLSVQFLESLGITPPLCNRVFVANLDYHVDKKKLKEVFRLAGKVQRVDLSVDKDGHSRGFAVIEYDHPVESVQAISMLHNQQLYDRVLTVRMDRVTDTFKLPEGLKAVGMGLGSNGEPLKDVARNLPSAASSAPAAAPAGAGILGAVPAPSVPIAALTGLNSVVGNSALGNLGTSAAVLQAANLAGMGGNLLGAGDLSLVSNGLVQNQSLSAAMAGNPSGLGGGGLGSSSNSGMSGGFSRNLDGGFGGGQSGGSQLYGSSAGGENRLYQGGSMDAQKGGYGSGYGGTGAGSRSSSEGYSLMGNSGPTMRSGGGGGGGGGSLGIKGVGYSNRILISNLPMTASYKMLTEKCSEFGNVQRLEDKGNGNVCVVYSKEWEAENAIKNLDRARIDGRTINVCFY